MTEVKANHTRLHKECVNAIRADKRIGRAEDFTLWENSKVQVVGGVARAQPGLIKGASDMLGILAPFGRIVAWEMKTGKATTTEAQDMFLELVRKRGGFACVLRADSTEQAVEVAYAALQRARLGLHE